jgi:ribosome maturation protein SDO1
MSTKTIIVRYKGFEILCKPKTVNQYRQGKLDLKQVLVSTNIYKNSTTGILPSKLELEAVFEDSDPTKCIEKILKKGDYQMTTEERREILDQRKAKVIQYFHKYYVNPKTNIPHTPTMIENGIREGKCKIDLTTSFDRTIAHVHKKLLGILPLKKCEMEVTLTIKHAYLGKVNNFLSKYATIKSDKYDHIGCTMEVGIVPGEYDTLLKQLNDVTKGDFEFDMGTAMKKSPSSAKLQLSKKELRKERQKRA